MKYHVSVVTPIFNTEQYLHQCIQSILMQKGVDLQLFLIDDASKDNSLNIANYYANLDSRVVVIKNESNIGQGPSRNKAITLANSEYIYFVDSDDYLAGDNTLKILYDTAKEYGLDVCSPDVPSHYFEKPMEAIACIPCKSQFIKLDIIKKFNIFQPDARSGQDGVFSHLVLSHCLRIGMNRNAQFHYTHAREGSTFASYLKNHDAVPLLIYIHYETITKHYDEYNLWQKNALRLANFIADETIRNRIIPHYKFLTKQQTLDCFSILSEISKKILDNLHIDYHEIIHPIIFDLSNQKLDDLVVNFESKWLNYSHKYKFKRNDNIFKKDIIICKIADRSFIPNKSDLSILLKPDAHIKKQDLNIQVSKQVDLNFFKDEFQGLKQEIKILKGKIDLAINTINNSQIHLLSALRSATPDLTISGKKDLVVSLTTLPHRLPLVHYAIESILSQTILPEKIILWISEVTNDNLITPELKALMKRGLEIRKVKDVGPHTKLIYSLINYPKKTIVSIDDDIIYPANMLQYLWDQHNRFPNAIVANWARELSFGEDGKVNGVRSGKLLTPVRLETDLEQAQSFDPKPNILAFPYGTSGVLYPPNSLSSKFSDVQLFRKLCPKEDDIWFKAMSLLNKTPVVVTNLGINPMHHSLVGTQQIALRHDNHGLGQNEHQMRAVFEYFDLYRFLN